MLLSELLSGTDVTLDETLSSLDVSGISYDTRRMESGNVFIALGGTKADGSEYALEAERKGAVLYIGEKDACGLQIPKVTTANARKTLALAYANFYGNPQNKLRIIGVTGTNGKTSTAFMLKNVLAHDGFKTALIGTVKCMIGDTEYVPKLGETEQDKLRTMTTPDPDILYMLMRDMVNSGVEVLVMEVSSHALALEKLAPIDFEIGIFTNLTEEHLDFHGSMDEYLRAKAKLFMQSKLAVINADDAYAETLAEMIPCKKVYFGVQNRKGYYAYDIVLKGAHGSEYVIHSENSRFKIKTTIPGHFTLYNTLAAAVTARELGVNLVTVQNALYSMNGVCGRLERVKLGFGGADISVFIDYAHTPFALENLLKCVNGFKTDCQRVVTLFGCGGDRDREKRSVMGKTAVEMSDFVIITGDNSRTEEPKTIINDILKGVGNAENYTVIEDRRKAIEYAITNAKVGDIILLVGKGHEQYEIDKEGLHPFSEIEIAEKAAEKRKI
ncbi:MAG: UDP-N-acetylmuramoyl-L-alanyl-D-glutamate--2,6-diaminopimelate ligase [Clostridia bacterium]|nr:UDP-N-acetylmuramoyl-L-alanyl-D-glutamate--2,6-diaminopimelate ligase [Clostridia bacterium]